MSEQRVIYWKSPITGTWGSGVPIPKDEAESFVNRKRTDPNGMIYWMTEVEEGIEYPLLFKAGEEER